MNHIIILINKFIRKEDKYLYVKKNQVLTTKNMSSERLRGVVRENGDGQ